MEHKYYLHPFIAANIDQILADVNKGIPAGFKAKIISSYRSPAEQFELYKKGRKLVNNKWVKIGPVVTDKDGYLKLSRHNYLPAVAFDFGIFKGDQYLGESKYYSNVQRGEKYGLFWGGNWSTLVDRPHLEIPLTIVKGGLAKDSAMIWQRYLQKSGFYKGAIDGIFGPASLKALKEETGEAERNVVAWRKLFDKYQLLSWP